MGDLTLGLTMDGYGTRANLQFRFTRESLTFPLPLSACPRT